MSEPPLKIQLLGGFQVWVEGTPIPRLRTRKGQALLAHLLLKHPAPIQREWLAGTLWPDSPEEQSNHSLRQCLNDLRGVLGNEGKRIQSPSRRTLAFDAEGVEADILDLQKYVKPTASQEELLSAIGLYGGHLLGESGEESLLKAQEELKQLFLNAVERVTPHLLQTEQWETLVPILQQAIQYEPLKESFTRNLMLTLAKQNDFAEVIQVYRELRLHLEQNLRTSPSPETTALYHKLREGSAQKQSVPPASSTPTQPSPSLATLPRPLIQLIGRETEQESLKERVLSYPLVTVLGMGGIGKTRLAHQVGYMLQSEEGERFGGGIWQVNLAPLSTPDLIPVTILSAMGRKVTPNHSLQEELQGALQDQPTLLILDNCEHIIEAVSEWVSWLLENCPQLHILATSRESFNITGELTYSLSPLALPSPNDDFTHLTQSPAVMLWTERARQHRPDFVLDAGNGLLVSSICRQLDGIPLAIELAAARLKLLDVAQIEARLTDRFRLLVGGSRTALPHHQTLRATIDWSYDLLSEEERVLFRRMSVFRGGCTLEAVESVCGVGEVLSPLSRLIDRSLVLADEERNGERRYRMLETLREYALERLEEAGERAEFQTKQFAWCLQLVQQGHSKLQGKETTQWLNLYDAEHDNLRTAIQNAPSPNERGILIAGLVRFWQYRGYIYEGQRWAEAALQNRKGVDSSVVARLLSAAGMFSMLMTDHTKAVVYFEQCLEHCAHSDEAQVLGMVHNNLGNTYSDTGKRDLASPHYYRALEHARQYQQKDVIARVLSNLGGVATEAHRFEEGLRYYQESVEIRREIQDMRGVAFIEMCLGVSEQGRKRYPEALEHYKKALSEYHSLGDIYNTCLCINYVIHLFAETRQAEIAIMLQSALKVLLKQHQVKLPLAIGTTLDAELAPCFQSLTPKQYEQLSMEGSGWTLEQTVEHIYTTALTDTP